MFQSARLKLTLWYVLIIMLVSVFFSSLIYQRVGLQFVQLEGRFGRIPPMMQMDSRLQRPVMLALMRQHFEDARRGMLLDLLSINMIILTIASAAGYFLAGKTLAPIQTAMKDQKRFIADASHELRTPLTAMRTGIEVALRGKKATAAEARSVLSGNLEEIEELERLTNGLLTLAKHDSFEEAEEKREIETSILVEKAAGSLRALAMAKGIELQTNIEEAVIKAREEDFSQMVKVLIENAIKYTPEKGKVIVFSALEGKKYKFEVEDSGIGISEDDIPNIFKRFYRVDQSRSKINVPGFGLGLSIAKNIVEGHSGEIKVESEKGKGSVFKVTLPASSN